MGGLTRSDFTAMRTIAKARDNNLANMFNGTKLVFAASARLNSVKGIVSDANSVRSGVSSMVKGIKTGSKVAATLPSPGLIKTHAMELIQTSMNLHDISDVVDAVTGPVLQELIGEITPLIGVLTSSYKSVQSWRAVVANARDCLQVGLLSRRHAARRSTGRGRSGGRHHQTFSGGEYGGRRP